MDYRKYLCLWQKTDDDDSKVYSKTMYWSLDSKQQGDIDYVEEGEDGLIGYEIKMEKNKVRMPKAWKNEYNGVFQLINRNNYLDLLLKGMR